MQILRHIVRKFNVRIDQFNGIHKRLKTNRGFSRSAKMYEFMLVLLNVHRFCLLRCYLARQINHFIASVLTWLFPSSFVIFILESTLFYLS